MIEFQNKHIVGYQVVGDNDDKGVPHKSMSEKNWLGTGYYFWTSKHFAGEWVTFLKYRIANKKKYTNTYRALIPRENLFDAIFNEEQAILFEGMIEKGIKTLSTRTGRVNLSAVLDEFYIDLLNLLPNCTGVMFGDHPTGKNDQNYIVLPYKKRIQIVVFDKKNIHNYRALEQE